MPEARERGALGLETRQLRARLIVDGLGGGELLLGGLLLGELLAVVLRQVCAALALFLLPGEVTGELGDQLAPGLPQARAAGRTPARRRRSRWRSGALRAC